MMTNLATRVRKAKLAWHHKQGHDLVYKEFGTIYQRVTISGELGDITVKVKMSRYEDMDIEKSGIFCIDCEKYVATDDEVDEWT